MIRLASVFACASLAVAATTSGDPRDTAAQAAPTAGDAPATTIALQRFQIPGGPRLLLAHAPQAKSQVTFTFLPITLVSDDAGCAQWSHLLEHMLIRSTDAQGLMVEGVTFNGETTHAYLRLETFAEPGEWKNALERQARWLAAREFAPPRLEREKGMIAMEENSTASNGYTTKFALAAWNQAVAHHDLDIAVHGDVQTAAAEDVNAYARRHIRLDGSALIASIGPTPVDEVRAEIERLLAQIEPTDNAAPATRPESSPTAPNAATSPDIDDAAPILATWDLPTRHAMVWWPLPDRRPQTLAAATAVARAMHLRFLSSRDRAKLARNIMVYPCVMSGERPVLLFDACLNAGTQPQQLIDAVESVVADLTDPASKSGMQTIVFAGKLASQETPLQTDFAILAQRMPAQLKDAVEGVWLLGLMNIEYAWGVPAEQAVPMLATLDEAAVADILARLKLPPRSLSLEPKAK